METRSRELPLTAAKPIYLRPRSLFPSLPPRFSVPSARCRSPPSGVSLRPAPAAFVIPLSLGRVPPAFQPVYKEDRVLHGDISLSRVLLGPREVEPERVAPAYARDPMWEGWRGGNAYPGWFFLEFIKRPRNDRGNFHFWTWTWIRYIFLASRSRSRNWNCSSSISS